MTNYMTKNLKIPYKERLQELCPSLTDEVLQLLYKYISKQLVNEMKKGRNGI